MYIEAVSGHRKVQGFAFTLIVISELSSTRLEYGV
jgi:hypothetical protein